MDKPQPFWKPPYLSILSASENRFLGPVSFFVMPAPVLLVGQSILHRLLVHLAQVCKYRPAMKLLSELLDGCVVYLSQSSHFVTPDFGRVLAQNGAIVSLTINARVRARVLQRLVSFISTAQSSHL